MKFLTILFLWAFSTSTLAQGYHTSCRLVKGEAEGWLVAPQFTKVEYDGDVTFHFYDDNFRHIRSRTKWDWCWKYSGAKLCLTVSAPSRAVSCHFDISAANPIVSE